MVTKPDLVDGGAEDELISIITNDRYYLKKGYTLVKCRGQRAINDRQSLTEALDEEQRYFEGEIFR